MRAWMNLAGVFANGFSQIEGLAGSIPAIAYGLEQLREQPCLAGCLQLSHSQQLAALCYHACMTLSLAHIYLSSFLNNRLVRSKIHRTHGRLIEAAIPSEDNSKQNVAAFGQAPKVLNKFYLS